MGRPNPRAPYVALDVMVKGAALPLREAIQLERDAFLDVATSPEGKAGMRFFFTQQSVQKLPKGFPGKARPLKKIGVDGIDGYMGNAIALARARGRLRGRRRTCRSRSSPPACPRSCAPSTSAR